MKPVYDTQAMSASIAKDQTFQIDAADIIVLQGKSALDDTFDVSEDGGVTWRSVSVRESVIFTSGQPVHVRAVDSNMVVGIEQKTLSHFLGDEGERLPIVTATTGPGGGVRLSAGNRPYAPGQSAQAAYVLIGGDHPYHQWWGRTGNDGLAAMYADAGIRPYLATNTRSVTGTNPGDPAMMTWDQIKALRDRHGVEVVSHGARHYQDSEAPDAGINITYTGAAATATVHVTATEIVATTAGGADNFSLAFATYPTIAEIVAAINATGKYTASYAAELAGSEASSSLLTIASGSAKSVKTRAGFSIAGGIRVWWDSGMTPCDSFVMELSSTTLNLYRDGCRIGNFTLSSYTLGSLVTAIKALNSALSTDKFGVTVTSIVADAGAARPYCTGEEDASNLARGIRATSRIPALRFPAVLSASRYDAHYLRKRNFTGAIQDAAAQGVQLNNFAQAGARFFKHMLHVGGASDAHIHLRGNNFDGIRRPAAMPACQAATFNIHAATNNDYDAPGHAASLVAAIAASPGHLCDMLVHGVMTDAALKDGSVAGSSGYYLNSLDIDNDMSEAGMVELLSALRTEFEAGRIVPVAPEEIAMIAEQIPSPRNLVFNPIFAHAPVDLRATDPNGIIVHGWRLNTASLPSVTASNGSITFTSAGVALVPINTFIQVKPGRRYRAGFNVATSGAVTSARVQIATRRGMWPDSLAGAPITSITADWLQTGGQVFIEFETPGWLGRGRAKIIGGNSQPFDLSTNKNISLTIAPYSAITIDGSAGAANPAAATAKDVAAAINAAIAANAQFVAASEWHTVARAENGRVVLEGPRRVSQPNNGGAISLSNTANSALTAVFGSLAGAAWPDHGGVENFGDYPVEMQFYMSAPNGATVTISDPFMREI